MKAAREDQGSRISGRRGYRVFLCLGVATVVVAGLLYHEFAVLGHFYPVVDGEVYRSSQPSAAMLRRWAHQYGLRTVVNLRGVSSRSFFAEEVRAARELGLELINVRFSALRLPPRRELRRLLDALATAPRPLLLHCKGGTDRTGVASTIAAMAIGGRSYRDAKAHVSWRYLRLFHAADDIGDVLSQYETRCAERGVSTGGWERFEKWARKEYHPYYYLVEISAPEAIEARPGERKSTRVAITNRSRQTIPAADPDKEFYLAVFSGSSADETPDRVLGPWARLPEEDIAPGESVAMTSTVEAPRPPGTYTIHFDLVEKDRTWFARQGSPVPTSRLIVTPTSEAAR